ncbi:structural maintenance of chromosomes protein 3 homolog [Anneissia japonica]|uniref:structural maintenance of chromosomes protein 3 homolog n=1 Tax=Anneissia japonica TaxID=1529436 RepID=UPI0014257719|nr:structural maintenance of chromosomes protein 3 homolog [Anneissia japonica]
MTTPKSNARLLGSVKVNRGVVFPPLTRSWNESGKKYFKAHGLSVQGDGMVTHKRIAEKEETPRTPSSRPHTSRSDPNHKSEELKEYQNRERQYKNRIQSLQKVNEQFKNEIAQKQEEIDALYIKFQKTEEHYKHLYDEEKQAHNSTKTEVADIRQLVTEKTNLISELKSRHQLKILEINTMHETKFNNLEARKSQEIADRDEKIKKLKMQMANILKDNSWERQQQLEELSKELNKISEEANLLRAKLKKHASKQTTGCENCATFKSLLDQKTKKVEEQEISLAHMMTIGKKLETQLVQQDVLLKQFAIKKGFKTDYQPK